MIISSQGKCNAGEGGNLEMSSARGSRLVKIGRALASMHGYTELTYVPKGCDACTMYK